MMQSVGVLISAALFLGLLSTSCNGDFFNHRPFPTYSLEDMPETGFNCRDKILGGYYADPDAQCQMFHICVKVAGLGIQDFRFLCPNGTAFDQDHQICADWEDVDCDASTLYYSSDNFDLYRVGSGFESKLHKYGEDEETFALQRAETGDIRLNREPQSKVVNQQKSNARGNYNNNNNNNNREKDIFKASSSSSFFNNRNNGKENDEDYDDDDDNVNANQNRDYENRRKVARKPTQRRPSSTTSVSNNEEDYSQTSRRPANRPTNGFVNNFAGSSYSTTSRPTTTTATSTQSAPVSNNRGRINNNHRISAYTVSTPAPFSRQQQPEQRFNNNNNNNNEAAITENYPSTKFQYKSNHASSTSNKKSSELVKPTTFSPKAKPFTYTSNNNNNGNTAGTFTNTHQHNSKSSVNTFYSTFLPTTFAPRTQSAFTDLVHKTPTQKSSISTYSTHYTPTVPRISSTTPLPIVSRSNRFDETQYDYNEEEFLKTAHSQNIASSRNELSKLQKVTTTTSTTEAANTNKFSENYPTRIRNTHQSPERKTTLAPHPSSNRYTELNLPKSSSTTTLKPAETKKKTKYASYDYAYYDSFGSEADYQIDTEIQKSKI